MYSLSLSPASILHLKFLAVSCDLSDRDVLVWANLHCSESGLAVEGRGNCEPGKRLELDGRQSRCSQRRGHRSVGHGWLCWIAGTVPHRGRTQPKAGCCGLAFLSRDSWPRSRALKKARGLLSSPGWVPISDAPASLEGHISRSKGTQMISHLSTEGTGVYMFGFPHKGPEDRRSLDLFS